MSQHRGPGNKGEGLRLQQRNLGTKYWYTVEILQSFRHDDLKNSCGQWVQVVLESLTKDWTVAFNFAHPGEHVPDIERENRTLQDRFRVNLYCLPFSILLRTIICYFALRVTKKRSRFPWKSGISKHYSPYAITKRKMMDYKKEYTISFGDYVQANHHHEIKTNNLPRSVDSIYLRVDRSE